MQTALTMLLKSKKPLPVTVTAQTIAKMVASAKTMLTTLKIVFFFIESHSFVRFKFREMLEQKEAEDPTRLQ